MNLRRVDPGAVDWRELDSLPDRTVFQTRQWLEFLAETQGGEPVLAEVRDGGGVLGYFSGLRLRRIGVPILGSSFPGWTTPYIGFNLPAAIPRRDALAALERFAFGELGCLHMEVSDPSFTPEDGAALGFSVRYYETYRTDLRMGEDELFASMTSACRRCIRKAEKSGVAIEEAAGAGFAAEYYDQLCDVFAKQGLVPTYGAARVEALVRHLAPAGRVLLLRARDAEGRSIGTGIYPGWNRVAEFWGNASFRRSQILRPNEALHWYAIRYWKKRGAEIFDWGGGGAYKEKYGPSPHFVPWFYKSRFRALSTARGVAQQAFAFRQRVTARLRGIAVPEPPACPEPEPARNTATEKQ